MGVTPVVEIELAGKKRHLKYTLRSIVETERKTGQNMLTKEGRLAAGQQLGNAEGLAFLLWTLLLHEDKSITVEQVQDMVIDDQLPQITEAILKARGFSLDDLADTEATEEAPLAQNRLSS